MSSESDELDPDEPRTPMWLPLLGSALFLVALMLFLATRSDDEVKAAAEPADSSAQGADADQGNDGKDQQGADDKNQQGAGDKNQQGADDKNQRGADDKNQRGAEQARPARPRPKRDPLRAAPPRGAGKRIPTPDPNIKVRRIQ